MYNWSVNLKKLKENPEVFERFSLEQKINFGLNNTKLSLKALKKHWNSIDIDPQKKSYLSKLLWK